MNSINLSTHLDSKADLDLLKSSIHVLVVGAGGLGCEILKCLLMSGIRKIDVIDMDTVDVSNLNRQFLFREEDVGRPKAEAAVGYIKRRQTHIGPFDKSETDDVHIRAHVGRVEDMDSVFYAQFSAIICGLDSLSARRWINSLVHSLVDRDEADLESVVPLIDGGTEGFLGTTRLIVPSRTSCVECNLDWYGDERRSYPLCTIAHTPRLPEHCIEYARIRLWADERPFNEEEFDIDNE